MFLTPFCSWVKSMMVPISYQPLMTSQPPTMAKMRKEKYPARVLKQLTLAAYLVRVSPFATASWFCSWNLASIVGRLLNKRII